MNALKTLLLLSLSGSAALAGQRALVEWNFNKPADLEAWQHSNHVADLRIEDGALRGRILDWDPFVRGPQFDIPATPYQRIELRLKTDCGGQGEVFWTNTTQSRYGGFFPTKRTPFQAVGDGQWHVYRIYPFWHDEKKIILLRLDFPKPADADKGKKTFAVDYVRIVDLGEPEALTATPVWDFTKGAAPWSAAAGASAQATGEGLRVTAAKGAAAITSGPVRCPIQDSFWVHVEMKVDRGSTATVQWVSSKRAGMQSTRFPIEADGEFHVYNLDVSGHDGWTGDALLFGLQPSDAAGATAVIRRIACGPDPMGGPEVECSYLGLEDAVSRAGRPATLLVALRNRGGTSAADLRIGELRLPDGVSVTDNDEWRRLPALDPFEPVQHRVRVQADGPAEGEVEVRLAGHGAPKAPLVGTVRFSAPLAAAKADYVPPPQPVKSDYEIGAFYFPGWNSPAKWQPIRTHAPQRKPVLGWYDEGNPECVDWQIKWAVEHGISFFLVDWYWSAGSRHLEHWLHAWRRARYRSHLKWAVMWANHNRPGSHSEQDMRDVARFWVEHYFGMPEYLRLDGRPVVVIWNPANIRRDLGGADGGRRALAIARKVATDAGHKGITFVAMKWPEAATDPAIIRTLADDGYDMTSIYHYMHHGDKASDPRHFPFELVTRSSAGHWRAWHAAGVLPFLPNLSTGWDSRPWHGAQATVIYGRSLEQFRRICEDAKRFADETGVKRLVLGPLNEWGEGSYAEPNLEFGFGMVDAVRDVFCQKPAGGWPPNLTPVDVGLGPYDFPEPPREPITAWTFARDAEGWSALMGVTDFRHEDGAIQFTTTSGDPAIVVALNNIDARKHSRVRIRMKVDTAQPGEKAQLFWSTTTAPVSEPNSVRFDLVGGGQYHDYDIPVRENSRWRGKITLFRLDPCSHTGARVAVAEVRLK